MLSLAMCVLASVLPIDLMHGIVKFAKWILSRAKHQVIK